MQQFVTDVSPAKISHEHYRPVVHVTFPFRPWDLSLDAHPRHILQRYARFVEQCLQAHRPLETARLLQHTTFAELPRKPTPAIELCA